MMSSNCRWSPATVPLNVRCCIRRWTSDVAVLPLHGARPLLGGLVDVVVDEVVVTFVAGAGALRIFFLIQEFQ